jgi:hypothetical protein
MLLQAESDPNAVGALEPSVERKNQTPTKIKERSAEGKKAGCISLDNNEIHQ